MKLFPKLTNIGTHSALNRHGTKKVRLLNYICVSWYFVLIAKIILNLFFNLDKKQNSFLAICSYFGQILVLMLVQYFQYKKRYEIARVLLISTSSIQTFIFCCFIDKGNHIEFFYIVMPLLSLLFLEKKKYHYFFLGLSIFCFSVVPELFHIYPSGTTMQSVLTMPVLFVVIFLMFNYFKNENIRNEIILESERKQIEQQSNELKEMNEFQTHFFVNITHELRTPLTLIKGNVFEAKKAVAPVDIHKKLNRILTHSNKIENLINDIIDVTKAETNTLTLSPELHLINEVIQDQFLIFKPLFEDNKINFIFSLPENDIYAEIDKLYFERVIGNILINAVKYTSKKGQVTVFIQETDTQISINVEDDGIGITLGEEEKIFNRFYQIDNDINKASGSGIGLAFCKEVIQLLRGEVIAFKNNIGGTTFSITLPKVIIDTVDAKPQTANTIDVEKPTLLLVDDNTEMREYLNSLLTDYNVIEANNGMEALGILEEQPVDALITDYMMPVMDGYELVRQVKERKYNFPILVITARADIKSKLDVLALGIDDYLTKPFVEEELIYRLRHSLLNAKNRTNYQKEDSALFQKEELAIPESDLIKKSRLIVEENIDNPLFGVPNLVEALNLTERTLYRKIKATAGLTPNQFIREIKLLHVRSLIEQDRSISISQLTKKVGLKNTSHLHKMYKERFGTNLY